MSLVWKQDHPSKDFKCKKIQITVRSKLEKKKPRNTNNEKITPKLQDTVQKFLQMINTEMSVWARTSKCTEQDGKLLKKQL